jgi:acetyl-CoA carboxylase carboxyl transferase subunit alpha
MDEIIPEPEGGAHRDPDAAAQSVKEALHRNLETLRAKSTETLLEERYQKYRRIGHYQESKLAQIQPHSKKGAHKKKPPR